MYTGYKVVTPSESECVEFYSQPNTNWFDCLTNEYLILKNADQEILGEYKWNGSEYTRLRFKGIDNAYSGKIHPRNPQQRCAFDLLQDDTTTIKILTGCFGSGY